MAGMAKAPRTKKPASAVFWGVYKDHANTSRTRLQMGRTRDGAVNAAAHELGFPPYSVKLA